MTTDYGLKINDLEIICNVFHNESKIEEAILFGSRAQGNYKNGSDIDIALKGKDLDAVIISHISYQLNEESPLPYKFDIVNYHTITNDDLVQQINRTGINIYSKSSKPN
jgi:predicted nucleotidyltransferase